ncbi:uncharacterized protein LOC144129943 [Amblyomma americanum]
MGPWGFVSLLLVSLLGQHPAVATAVHVDHTDGVAPSHPDPQPPAVSQQSADAASVVPPGNSTPRPNVTTTYTPTPSTALHVQSHAHNGVHHPLAGFTTPAHPTQPPNDVRRSQPAVPVKSEPEGQDPVVEGRQRYPGYNRPYYPNRRPGRQRYPGYNRPYYPNRRPGYNRPGGYYPNRRRPYRPYRPYLRDYLVEPEFETYGEPDYGEPAYRRASNIGRVLEAFLRVVTRIVGSGKPGTVKGTAVG